MSNTYSWEITQLDCFPSMDGNENVVSGIGWARTATDGTNNACICGLQPLKFTNISNFTPYPDLTQVEIIQWLERSIGVEKLAEIDANLDAELVAKATPVVINPKLPWA